MRFALAVVRQMNRLEPFDRAMTLAAQAFTSIFPVVIAAFTLLPQNDSGRLGSRVAHALALPESTRSAMSGAFPAHSDRATTFGLLSLLIVLISATSFSRAMTRMYAKLWSVRGPGWRSPWRWIAAIVAIASCTVAVQVLLRMASGSVEAMAGALLLSIAVNALLWTWVPSVLLASEVPWRHLAPGGLLMGAATVATYFASRVYLPSAMDYADRHYGELGVAFTAIGWLFCVAFVLIVASVLGFVVATEPGPAARVLGRRSAHAAPAAAPPEGLSSRTSDAPSDGPVHRGEPRQRVTMGPPALNRVRETSMHQPTYEIHLRGALPPPLLDSLKGATCTETGGETLLLTLDIDQGGLHQLVGRLRDLGIELLELRQVRGGVGGGHVPEQP